MFVGATYGGSERVEGNGSRMVRIGSANQLRIRGLAFRLWELWKRLKVNFELGLSDVPSVHVLL